MAGKKILIIVMDGLGDRAVKELGYKTPLQAAKKPNLDWFAQNGSTGAMDVIGPGVRPGSDTSHLAILGYDPYEVYTGRGPFEAAGVGLIGKKGDVAFRCNFATVDDDFNVLDRRAGRIKEPDTSELVKALEGLEINGIRAIVKDATEHRAVLLLRGDGLDAHVTDADPHEVARVHVSRPLVPEAKRTADAVNEFVKRSYELLKDHPVNVRRKKEGKPPANILLPRGAGPFPDIVPFEERWGLTASCVAGVSLIKGICKMCGLEVVEPSGGTGGLDTNMEAKARVALRELEKKDFVLMNVKATDVASHDGDARTKVEVIERLDKMAKVIREGIPPGTVVVLTADHCTPVERGDHSGDPVPLCIYSDSTVKDGSKGYDEAACYVGGLGRIRGKDLMPILIDKTDRSEKFGA
ncbi:2,3-bisphosphoglycerate-independent phosphoglycerate mutase [Methanomassiliicoccus luminyensis]|uniref:2,3-bisphosphoglycerate-independent phosphoglycerate mutase n=1 Tax=Methanomassiliicoccus luminyensis TaxID=1080712 RepID=UPI00037EE975|nr:2,3-bisphosphoglycerate-independent phosphoglycerate mutase [Methanomassiliicoccus luminyensis]